MLQLTTPRRLLAAVVAGAAMAMPLAGVAMASTTPAAAAAPLAAQAPQVVVSGQITGLYPGFSGTMSTLITNTYGQPLRLTTLNTRVFDANVGCGAALLTVSQAFDRIDVPANGTALAPLLVRLDLAAPDACQGATWPLLFTAALVGDDGSDLPSTGVSTVPLLFGGAGLVAAGLIAVGVVRLTRRGEQ